MRTTDKSCGYRSDLHIPGTLHGKEVLLHLIVIQKQGSPNLLVGMKPLLPYQRKRVGHKKDYTAIGNFVSQREPSATYKIGKYKLPNKLVLAKTRTSVIIDKYGMIVYR